MPRKLFIAYAHEFDRAGQDFLTGLYFIMNTPFVLKEQ